MHVQTIFLIEKKKATCFSELLLFGFVHKDFGSLFPVCRLFLERLGSNEGIRFNRPFFLTMLMLLRGRRKKKHNWYILQFFLHAQELRAYVQFTWVFSTKEEEGRRRDWRFALPPRKREKSVFSKGKKKKKKSLLLNTMDSHAAISPYQKIKHSQCEDLNKNLQM